MAAPAQTTIVFDNMWLDEHKFVASWVGRVEEFFETKSPLVIDGIDFLIARWMPSMTQNEAIPLQWKFCDVHDPTSLACRSSHDNQLLPVNRTTFAEIFHVIAASPVRADGAQDLLARKKLLKIMARQLIANVTEECIFDQVFEAWLCRWCDEHNIDASVGVPLYTDLGWRTGWVDYIITAKNALA